MTTKTTITFDRLQTLAGSSFDLETISVGVGRIPETDQLKLTIRNEKSGISKELKFNLDATEDQVKRLIQHTAEELGLVAGPSRHED